MLWTPPPLRCAHCSPSARRLQFYDESFTLLSRLLGLLRGFINRSHQSLAAVGVAAFVRLCINAGGVAAGRRARCSAAYSPSANSACLPFDDERWPTGVVLPRL
jgi:hypothetical protein